MFASTSSCHYSFFLWRQLSNRHTACFPVFSPLHHALMGGACLLLEWASVLSCCHFCACFVILVNKVYSDNHPAHLERNFVPESQIFRHAEGMQWIKSRNAACGLLVQWHVLLKSFFLCVWGYKTIPGLGWTELPYRFLVAFALALCFIGSLLGNPANHGFESAAALQTPWVCQGMFMCFNLCWLYYSQIIMLCFSFVIVLSFLAFFLFALLTASPWQLL